MKATPIRLAAALCLAFSAPALGQAPKGTAEDPTELPSAEEAARLFGTVADTSRFLMVPGGSLDTLAARVHAREGRPIVVVQYGDSHTQAGILPRELRDQLAAGGRASPGFVAPGFHNLGDVSVATAGRWKKKNWLKAEDGGSFGPLGTAFVTHDVHARVMLHLTQAAPAGTTVTAFYSKSSAHLPFRLVSGGAVLGQAPAEGPAAIDGPKLGLARVTLTAGTTDVELAVLSPRKPGPDLRFFGFLVQEPGAVVEWDAMGVTGTSVEHPLRRGDTTVEEYLALRQPDLVIVWFGSNSLVSPAFDPKIYERDFEDFLSRLERAAPSASRLAIGPPDLARRPASCPTWYGHQKRHLSARDRALLPRYVCAPETTIVHRPGHGDLFPVRSVHSADEWLGYIQRCAPQTLPGVTTATNAERDAARSQGYAFFDTFAFMDGPGSIHRWACQTPRLAAYDLVHLTADGYSTLAQGVWGALPAAIRNPSFASVRPEGGAFHAAGSRSMRMP